MKQERHPRDLAVRALTRVLSDHRTLEDALEEVCQDAPPGTRGWLQDVCSGTLRWKGRLDLALDSVALKKKPSGWLRKVLLVGAYQLIAQDRSAAGAVVSETVDEIKKKEGDAPAKFANACLRKLSEHAKLWRELEPVADRLADWASLPEWMARDLEHKRGRPWLEAYARASLDRPVLWLRARRPEWKPEGVQAEAGPIPGSWRVEGPTGAIPELKGFAEGEFIVQDISSQVLVAEVAKAVGGHGRALDLCAAPGGKSVNLAWSGFAVSASDQDSPRMELLKQTVDRARASIQIVEKAALAGLPAQDLVWVDAPCTGSGILRRHPEVRWLRQEKELDALAKLQTELLKEGWAKVRPGGWLLYSVCSVLKREGPGAVAQAGLNGHQSREWDLGPQIAPHGDGFWAALLHKPGAN